MTDDLRRWMNDLTADMNPPLVTSDVVSRATAGRRQRQATEHAGRVAAAATGGAVMITAILVVVVVSLGILGPRASGPAPPAAAATGTATDLAPASPGGTADRLVPGPLVTTPLDTPSAGGTDTGRSTIGKATPAPTPVVTPTPVVASTPPPPPSTLPPPATTSTPTTPAKPSPILVDAGGTGVAGFRGDSGFSGGTAYSLDVPVDTSAQWAAAPALYTTVRFGEFEYDVAGLVPGSSHLLRLHWAELDFHNAGDRVFDVAVNGVVVLDGVDVVAAAGGARRAFVREVPVTADPSGRLQVSFRQGGADFPFLSGLELSTR